MLVLVTVCVLLGNPLGGQAETSRGGKERKEEGEEKGEEKGKKDREEKGGGEEG